MLRVPFRISVTELISSVTVDTSGTVALSDILETVILEEFTIALGTVTVVDEMDLSIGSVIPNNVSLQCKALPVVVHVTSRLSPTRHTAAPGEEDINIVTAPV